MAEMQPPELSPSPQSSPLIGRRSPVTVAAAANPSKPSSSLPTITTLPSSSRTMTRQSSGSSSASPRTNRRPHSMPSTDPSESPELLPPVTGGGWGGGGDSSGGGTRDSEGEEGDPRSPGSKRSGSFKDKDKDKWTFFTSPRHKGGLLTIFSASHRHKNSEIHKIFTTLPEAEKLIDDYSAALQRDILIHGRLYVTQSWLCFYANIFSWETLLTIPFQSVQAITKEKTALVIPNAIQISTSADRYGFSSLVNRDVTYNIVFKCWQNHLLNQPLTPLELVQAARKAHGESVEVGTEEDLWGPPGGIPRSDEEEDGETPNVVRKQASMPTHLEIGLLPVSTLAPPTSDGTTPHPAGVRHAMSVPVALNRVHNNGTAASEGQVIPSSTPGAGGGLDAGDLMTERVSMGGESVNSSEYETVSMMEETGEVPCGCSEHVGRTIINDVYATDVETIFQLLFTDSPFMRNFYKAEKTSNADLGEWQPQTDGRQLRDMAYTLALNYNFGPKFSHTTEHQVYSKLGQPGLKHLVDTEVVNHDIPYSDTFYVACRYCMTRVAHNQCRLRITATIKFKKSCWGLVKSLIERNAGDGLRSYYNHLDVTLKEHIASLPAKRKKAHRRASRSTNRLKHKRLLAPLSKPPPSSSSSSPPAPLPHLPPILTAEGNTPVVVPFSAKSMTSTRPLYAFPVGDSPGKQESSSVPRVNLALTILLSILIVSNMVLYHHLMSYQVPAAGSQSAQHQDSGRYQTLVPGEWPSTNEEWVQLFGRQAEAHSNELSQWKNTLYTTVQALDKVESMVLEIKLGLVNQLDKISHQAKSGKGRHPPSPSPSSSDDGDGEDISTGSPVDSKLSRNVREGNSEL